MAEVYYVPGLKSNLLSVGHLMKKGYDLHMHGDTCIISKANQVIAKIGMASNNLFPFKPEIINLSLFAVVDKSVSKLWHERYGHLNYESLKLLSTKEIVRGLLEIDQVEEICKACQLGKQHRDPFPQQLS